MKALRRGMEYYRSYGPTVALAVALGIVGLLANLAAPLVMRATIDTAIPQGDIGFLLLCASGVLALPAMSRALLLLQGHLLGICGRRATQVLQTELIAKAMRWPLRKWDETPSGEVLGRLLGDAPSLQRLATSCIPTFLSSMLGLPAACAALAALNTDVAVVSSVALPLYVLPAVATSRPLRAAWRALAEAQTRLVSALQETVTGVRTLKDLTQEDYHLRRLAVPQRDVLLKATHAEVVNRLNILVTGAVAAVGPAFILFYGGLRAMAGGTSVGTLVACITYLVQVYGAVSSLPTLYAEGQHVAAGLERVFEFVDSPIESEHPEGAMGFNVLPNRTPDVRVQSLSFGYRTDCLVLTDLTFDLGRGEVCALVGPSGAGKTTVARLLLGYYKPSSGRILIRGKDVTAIPPQVLRRMIGLVSQETFLFNASIRDNLLYANPDALESDVLRALEAAQLREFVGGLSGGLDTLIGEQGVLLSAGQRQRLALARMLLRNPEILILDEATSGLDHETEAQLQMDLRWLMKGKSCLIITHREALSTMADRVIALPDPKGA